MSFWGACRGPKKPHRKLCWMAMGFGCPPMAIGVAVTMCVADESAQSAVAKVPQRALGHAQGTTSSAPLRGVRATQPAATQIVVHEAGVLHHTSCGPPPAHLGEVRQKPVVHCSQLLAACIHEYTSRDTASGALQGRGGRPHSTQALRRTLPALPKRQNQPHHPPMRCRGPRKIGHPSSWAIITMVAVVRRAPAHGGFKTEMAQT